MLSHLSAWRRFKNVIRPGGSGDGDNLRDYALGPTQYVATGKVEMAVISSKQSASRVNRPESRSGRPTTFVAGFFHGLCAAGSVLAGALPRVKAPEDGIASDWNSIGADLDHALNRHGR
jgi:hypothetical protein